jgi:DnaK suppressor protein
MGGIMKKIVAVAESQQAHREKLLEKRRSVLSGLGNKFDTLARMGRLAEEDQAQISHDEFVSLHLNGMDYLQLRLVDEALDRMDSGDYGVCLACEAPIPAKRLQALPWAKYCLTCQEIASDETAVEGRNGMPRGMLHTLLARH